LWSEGRKVKNAVDDDLTAGHVIKGALVDGSGPGTLESHESVSTDPSKPGF
jgi:hypothetical protein